MPERFGAVKRTVGEILGMSFPNIEVSTVQRDYSWGTEQVRAFWDDLTTFIERFPG